VHQQKTKRVASSEIPTFIRASGTSINRTDRAYLRRKLGRRLGKFAPAVERVSVRIEDVNSLRGGIDKRCRIKVVLSGLSSVMIDQRHPVLQATMDRALRRLEMAVRRRVKRRQEHRGSSPTPAT
jgi:ribosome-associated translation inhibitor RaiA